MNPFNRTISLIAALVYGGVVPVSAEPGTVTTDLTVHWDASAPLANPHKGWYHHYYDNCLTKYLPESDAELTGFPGMDHVYLRLAWAYLEPREGEYDWRVLDEMIAKWTRLGLGISLRITCKETGTDPVEQQFATPRWVMEAGAKGGFYRDGRKSDDPSFPWEPAFDDPVFLSKLESFIRVLAKRYDGKPWLRYVDVGSLGDWGEGHTYSGSRIRYTWQTRQEHLAIHTRHFVKSQLVVTDDFVRAPTPEGCAKLHRYCAEHGISYRDDSILVGYWTESHGKTFSVADPELFVQASSRYPTVLELAHLRNWATNGYWEGKPGTPVAKFGSNAPEFIRGAIRTMRATYIGYHGSAARWMALDGNPQLSNELLNLSGYWYFPHRLKRPDPLVRDRPNEIAIDWENRGVAPAYQPYRIQFRFAGPDTATVTLDAGNLDWLPGKDPGIRTARYPLTLPSNLAPGSYTLSFRLFSPQVQRPVLLPLTPGLKDDEAFCPLGEVQLR